MYTNKELELEEYGEEWESFTFDEYEVEGCEFDEFGAFEEHEEEAPAKKRYIILTIYDIVDNKKRSRMVKYLEKYGVRVQKSCFEAYITKELYERMKQECQRIIDPTTDSLRMYMLSDFHMVQSWGLGDTHIEDVIIF